MFKNELQLSIFSVNKNQPTLQIPSLNCDKVVTFDNEFVIFEIVDWAVKTVVESHWGFILFKIGIVVLIPCGGFYFLKRKDWEIGNKKMRK